VCVYVCAWVFVREHLCVNVYVNVCVCVVCVCVCIVYGTMQQKTLRGNRNVSPYIAKKKSSKAGPIQPDPRVHPPMRIALII